MLCFLFALEKRECNFLNTMALESLPVKIVGPWTESGGDGRAFPTECFTDTVVNHGELCGEVAGPGMRGV